MTAPVPPATQRQGAMQGVQASFDSLGQPLSDVTFVVVDLETTGGSPNSCQITEIGAVKVRGGVILGEFQTLVNPGELIPPFIAVLTGITNQMVSSAPALSSALPAFLQWAGGSVYVAHNAPFDLGFLRAGCEQLGIDWPQPGSVDTARLARRVLTRDEAPDCKLSTLSRLFRATTTPCHWALADAQATVDVLHGLLERLGPLGVQTWDDLRTFAGLATPGQRRKRHLADGLPDGPGVYVFTDAAGRPLYIGRSRALRQRVRQYFTAAEPRTRITEMVTIAERVDAISCAHDLEAQVREVRLIAEHKPRYNRRSKFPERAVWLVLTNELFPRLSIIHRSPVEGEAALGPIGSSRLAQAAMTAIYDTVPLRQCAQRISSQKQSPRCALADLGRCSAPCDLAISAESYAAIAAAAAELMSGRIKPMLDAADAKLHQLAEQQRFEEAASVRDRIGTFVRTADRMQRLSALGAVAELIAARPTDRGGWELAVIRHGRLVAAACSPAGAPPREYVLAAQASAETVEPGFGPTPAASAEEMELILRWLDGPDVRLVTVSNDWASPIGSAGSASWWIDRLDTARSAAEPFADRRGLRPVSRPARSTA